MLGEREIIIIMCVFCWIIEKIGVEVRGRVRR
jgi:hypothetical protein